eukprot:113344_1
MPTLSAQSESYFKWKRALHPETINAAYNHSQREIKNLLKICREQESLILTQSNERKGYKTLILKQKKDLIHARYRQFYYKILITHYRHKCDHQTSEESSCPDIEIITQCSPKRKLRERIQHLMQ